VEAGAGTPAFYSDADYSAKGAEIVVDRSSLLGNADVVVSVQPLRDDDVRRLRSGAAVISFLPPSANAELVKTLAERSITSYALDLVPRISRAQSMDALSSQALVAGYMVTLAAAERLPKFFPMFMTAAGTVPPAKVLVLGTGVAGLQVIATARRLGAVVEAYDVRSAARDAGG
jgi:NAD(P) transhydrogenase subunit alpha